MFTGVQKITYLSGFRRRVFAGVCPGLGSTAAIEESSREPGLRFPQPPKIARKRLESFRPFGLPVEVLSEARY
jgi:hypothetical protein